MVSVLPGQTMKTPTQIIAEARGPLRALDRFSLWDLLAFNQIYFVPDATQDMCATIGEGTGRMFPEQWQIPPKGWHYDHPHPDTGKILHGTPAATEPEPEPEPEEKPLEDMKIGELRSLVKSMGLEQSPTDDMDALREKISAARSPVMTFGE